MRQLKQVVAVIPIKLKSERVLSKNFKGFHQGKSLTDMLIDKLSASKHVEKIYISSNAIERKDYFNKKGCIFIKRPELYCSNDIPWSDVIYEVISSVPESEQTHIAWCHSTSPLFESYDDAIMKYFESIERDNTNGLVTVIQSSDFLVTEKMQPINYSWGPWHKYSQNLQKMYKITGALFIAKKKEMLKNRYVISSNPGFYEVTPLEAIDVDTQYDFELAKVLVQQKNNLKKYV